MLKGRLQLFIPLASFLLLVPLFYWALDKDPKAMPSALVGRTVPNFNLPELFDAKKSIDQTAIAGKPYLINFWATWCPSCKVEHPFLMELSEAGIDIVGVNLKDDSALARAELSRTGNPYRINVSDLEGNFSLDMGVYGAPETFVVDENGVVLLRYAGPITKDIWSSKIAPVYFGH